MADPDELALTREQEWALWVRQCGWDQSWLTTLFDAWCYLKDPPIAPWELTLVIRAAGHQVVRLPADPAP